MADELELFNAHQEDVRRRADLLARAVFILAGGTLTVSIGIFTGDSSPELASNITCALKISWWSLFAAIIFLVLTLTTIIARDYAFGERWRKKINGQTTESFESPTIVEIIIWVQAILGLICFLIGLLGQAYVASNVL